MWTLAQKPQLMGLHPTYGAEALPGHWSWLGVLGSTLFPESSFKTTALRILCQN